MVLETVLSDTCRLWKGISVIRVLRILNLKKFRGVRSLVITVIYSFPMIFNILSLMIIVFFIYAVLGCYLFSSLNF